MSTPLDLLKNNPPMSGRMVTEDGAVLNVADVLRLTSPAIARGLYPGASRITAYGERISSGAETDFPVWANGPTVGVAPSGGVAMTIQSTEPADSLSGANARQVEVHYLRDDLTEGERYFDLDGTNSVSLIDPDIRFVQAIHITAYGANKTAAGIITVEDAEGTIYQQIAVGGRRSVSSYRMVPKGKELHVDTLVFSSISGTAATRTTFRFVATFLGGHTYLDPALFIPHATIGLQDNAIPVEGLALEVFTEGTIVGVVHTSDKGAVLSATWSGRLLPAMT